ncbi:MAG: hypothetical protein ABIQ32_04010 [Sphingomicrobium sp.]
MVQNSNELPEGTDTIIAGASETGVSDNDTLVVDPAPVPDAPTSGGAGTWTEKLRGSTENLTDQAGTKARDLVGQGLERGSEALANVSRLIGDSAGGLDERLGEDFGNYARRAATSLEDVANRLATKDPDELFDDTREFIRKSPGVALAGAAIAGFVLTRLIKNGLSSSNDDDAGEPGPTRSAD